MRTLLLAAFWWAVPIACCLNAQHVFGAELVKADGALCELKLQGTINPGDFKKLEEGLISRTRLCLNSPGGSYIDGLQFFAHFSDNRIATVVAASDACFSACAIAFMGGADGAYGDRFPDRTLHSGGRLGFHRPFLVRDGRDLAGSGDQLTLGVSVGIAVVAKLIRSDKYNLLPKLLIAEMLETHSPAIYYIDTFRKARTFKITLAGLKEPEKITKLMLYYACVNSDPWSDDIDSVDAKDAKTSEVVVISRSDAYRILFAPFGFQGMEKCAVDVLSRPGNQVEVYVQLKSGEPQPQINAADKAPIWYLYSASAAISQHARPN